MRREIPPENFDVIEMYTVDGTLEESRLIGKQ